MLTGSSRIKCLIHISNQNFKEKAFKSAKQVQKSFYLPCHSVCCLLLLLYLHFLPHHLVLLVFFHYFGAMMAVQNCLASPLKQKNKVMYIASLYFNLAIASRKNSLLLAQLLIPMIQKCFKNF